MEKFLDQKLSSIASKKIKMILGVCNSLIIVMLGTSCTPTSIIRHQLIPARNQNVLTIKDIGEEAYSLVPLTEPRPSYEDTIVLEFDEALMSFSLYELKNIVWLDITVRNWGETPMVINPSELVLMDSNRFLLNRIEPHAAANIFLAQVSGIPPYTPKYNYYAHSSTSGHINAYGNYSAQTDTTVTQEEDPYYALGYALGAALTQSENKKLIEIADRIYSKGLVDGATIPSKANAIGCIYWQKPKTSTRQFILKWENMDYEVSFSRVWRR